MENQILTVTTGRSVYETWKDQEGRYHVRGVQSKTLRCGNELIGDAIEQGEGKPLTLSKDGKVLIQTSPIQEVVFLGNVAE